MKIKERKLRLYKVDEEYIEYLRAIDKRVSIKKGRPFIGILVSERNQDYCVPLTSQVIPASGKNRNKKITTIIRNNKGESIAAVLYNNMIPVFPEVIQKIRYEPNDKEWNRLNNEILYLNKKSILEEVQRKAEMVLTIYNQSSFLKKVCVDIGKLEKAAKEYERVYLLEREWMKTMENKEAPKSVKERLVEAYIKCLEEGTIPWYRGWNLTAPIHNMSSGRAYTGYNRLILQLESAEAGYKDPRWLTFFQMHQMGFSMDKGTKGVRLDTWYVIDTKAKKTISLDEYNRRKKGPDFDPSQYLWRPGRPVYVFNAEQLNGVPPLDKKLIPIKGNEVIEQIPEKMGVTLTYGGDKGRRLLPQKRNIWI